MYQMLSYGVLLYMTVGPDFFLFSLSIYIFFFIGLISMQYNACFCWIFSPIIFIAEIIFYIDLHFPPCEFQFSLEQ